MGGNNSRERPGSYYPEWSRRVKLIGGPIRGHSEGERYQIGDGLEVYRQLRAAVTQTAIPPRPPSQNTFLKEGTIDFEERDKDISPIPPPPVLSFRIPFLGLEVLVRPFKGKE